MTVTREFIPRSGQVHVGSFLFAALATPLLVGIGGIQFILPPFAAWYGFPAYLVLGLPLFWAVIKRCDDAVQPGAPVPFVVAGLIACLGVYPLYFSVYASTGGSLRSAEEAALVCFAFGIIFAPLHGLVFGVLYCGLRSGSGGTGARLAHLIKTF